jgi:hypothetical protein
MSLVGANVNVDLNRLLEQLVLLMQSWRNRNQGRVSNDTDTCTFWRKGMLNELDAIAGGDTSQKTLKRLQAKFYEGQGAVTRAMQRLEAVRHQLGPGEIAETIDKVLHCDEYGKRTIRDEIENLIRLTGDRPEKARDICDQIKKLNSELRSLNEMVQAEQRNRRLNNAVTNRGGAGTSIQR